MAAPEPKSTDVLLTATHAGPTRPLWLVRPAGLDALLQTFTSEQRAWIANLGFKAAARKHVLLPGGDGAVAGVLLGLGETPDRIGAEPAAILTGLLPTVLPVIFMTSFRCKTVVSVW